MTITAELSGYDKAGLQLVRIVISDRGKRKRIPTKIFVEPKHWDQTKQRVKPSAPNSDILNQALSIQLADLQKTVAVSGVQDLINKKKMPVYDFISEMDLKLSERNKFETMEKWRSQVNKLKKFAPNISLQDITADFIEKYESWCRKEQGNKDGGVNNSIQFINQVVNKGIAKGLLPANQTEGFRKKSYKPKTKTHLTRDEIDRFEAALKGGKESHLIVGYYFLLSCYTGLRYRDCKRLNKGMVSDGRLILYTNKTGEPVSLKITPKIDALLKECLKYTLPANSTCHNILPTLAKNAGIKKHVSFHTGRHSFGCGCAALGIPIEVTSKLMAHNNLSTTAIYYRIMNPVLDNAMEKWI